MFGVNQHLPRPISGFTGLFASSELFVAAQVACCRYAEQGNRPGYQSSDKQDWQYAAVHLFHLVHVQFLHFSLHFFIPPAL